MMIDKLIGKIIEKENPSVVGLDPRLDYVPKHIWEECREKFGKTPKAVSEAFFMFNKEIIDATHDLIPAVKPQIAMYEEYGAPGIDAYVRTIKYAKKCGLIVIGDIKRGDIASTAEAYSRGHIGIVDIEGMRHEVYGEDFITVNPYMGWDSIEPYIPDCRDNGKGLFVLVKTSNPMGGQFQDLMCDGEPLHVKVGRMVQEWGEGFRGKYGYSSIGAVVGATHPLEAAVLRKAMPNTFFLVPGYGAQGAGAEDIRSSFDQNGLGAIVNSSRGIIAAHLKTKKYDEKEFALAARDAVLEMKNDLKF